MKTIEDLEKELEIAKKIEVNYPPTAEPMG